MDGSLFGTPAAYWSDAEIRVGLGELCTARDAAAEAGEHGRADRLGDLAVVLATERDRRRRLAVAVEERAADITDLIRFEDDEELPETLS